MIKKFISKPNRYFTYKTVKYALIFSLIAYTLLTGCSSGDNKGVDDLSKNNENSEWPMWRYDAGRSASADINIPENPILIWTRQLEEPKRCWPFQYEEYYTSGNPSQIGKLSFDISYEPVIGEGKLFVPSMVSDRITAYSTDSGKELWRYYAAGPVRFAPVYDAGRVYFISDDGYLYCLKAKTGKLIWKYKGCYSSRMVLGNERIISLWPSRGGPVIKDGIIYFASGVIPFEGTFIHAVDARTGNKIWTNSTSGSQWMLHQHGGALSFGGPSPQGYLAISGDKLIVSGGRTPPAIFNRANGKFLYFNLPSGNVGKGAGGYIVSASEEWFFNHGMMYCLKDGAQYGHIPSDVITKNAFIGKIGTSLVAHNSDVKKTEIEIADRLSRGAIKKIYHVEKLWETEVDNIDRLFFKTDSNYVISKNKGKTAALLDISSQNKSLSPAWEYDIDGEIWSMLAGDNKLYIITRQGEIYCFGTSIKNKVKHYPYKPKIYKPKEKYADLADSIIQKTGISEGYGLIYKTENIDLIKCLADKSSMHFVVVESNKRKIKKMRRRFDDYGLYGKRISIVEENNGDNELLPYIYRLIILKGDKQLPTQIEKIYNSLRPYGGTACFIKPDSGFPDEVNKLSLVNSNLLVENNYALLIRQGPLQESGEWTHQYANASNRTYSEDKLVKAPLGTLWFGGPSNINVLPRHHLGPIPQVAGGRLFILGVETISARCVYTGKELWVKEIPGIGHPFTDLELEEQFMAGNEVYMSNHPGANFIGSPYVSLKNKIYIIYKDKLLTLDSKTGETLTEFRLPETEDIKINEFSHIMIWDDYLITAVDPQMFDDGQPGKIDNWNATSSSRIIVMNRYNGNVLWTTKAEKGFRHNAIVAGNGRLFLIDGLSEGVISLLQRRGENISGSKLMAFNMENGQKLWSVNDDVFGTWLGYYEDKDILIEAGRYGGKKNLPDEPRDKMKAHSGKTGEVIWTSNQHYSGALGLHPDMIVPGKPGETVLNPCTGEPVQKNHPVTNKKYNWHWYKYYGCGTMNSCKYLIAFRSGSAGYSDLLNFSGTGNFSGWKSGCTNSLVPADGLLNGPDYTRTCTCSYPLQCSYGLIHMPEAGVEMWTFNRLELGNEVIRTLGINFGAPGNRREDGILWIEYPKVYPDGPDIPVEIESDSLEWFGNHATWIRNPEEKYNWVGSYGAKGIKSLSVKLAPGNSAEERYYSVTLYFAEPDDITVGERIFDVSLQGEKVLENFDISEEAGGLARVISKKFTGIKVKDVLTIEMSDKLNKSIISGVQIEY
jgi:outer membrane protein assembly factor BamB